MNRSACIYIGPNLIEVVSAQRGAARKVKILDKAFYPLEIDTEIHETGVISVQSGQLLQRVLKEYIRLAQENLPERIDLIISNEVTTANNFVFLYKRLEDIARDCQIQILSPEEELELFCAYSKLYLSEKQDIEKANILMAEINSEIINFALTADGIIDFTEQIPYGYEKLAEIVEKITRQRTRYSKLLSEIIESKLRLAVSHIGKRGIELVSLACKDTLALAQNFPHEGDGYYYTFSKATIDKVYHILKELTPDQIRHLYPSLTEAQSVTIQSSVIVARRLINTAGADSISLIQPNIAEAVVRFRFKSTQYKEIRHWLEEGSYQSAIEISKRYQVDQEHADAIEHYALRIFDTLKKYFSLNNIDRRYLRLACRLLDVGQYGGEDGQAQAGEDIILREDIIGLSYEDRKIIGRVCRNTKLDNYDRTVKTHGFTMDQFLSIAQLTAILKIASALDQSRRQKVSKLQCAFSEEDLTLTIKITTSHNTQLESYYFERDSVWMKRIFEVTPILKVKRVKV